MSLYGLLWRLLPGPVPAKVLQALLLVAVVVWLLFAYAFPVLNEFTTDPGVG